MLQRLNTWSLSTKLIILSTLGVVAVVGVNYVLFMQRYQADVSAAMVEKAAAFTAVADEAKNHTSALIASGAINMPLLAEEAAREKAAGKKISDLRLFKAIPVVAGWTTARLAAKREGIDFQVPSFNARNPDNEPKPGSFRAQLLGDLEKQVASSGPESIHRVDTATNTLHYMRAIKLDESCMSCHGDPSIYGRKLASGENSKVDVLGYTMEGWKIGQMHGAYEVALPMAPLDAKVAGAYTTGGMVTGVLVLVAGIATFFLLRALVSVPMGTLLHRVRELAEGDGDLTRRVGLNRADEFGQLGKYTDAFITKIHDLMVTVSGSAVEVAAAATEVAASSENIAANMEQQAKQVTQAAAAVEEMSRSATQVASHSNEAMAKSKSAGAAAEQGVEVVNQTIGDMTSINAAVAASADIVTGLGKRGDQIGEVIQVINDIADQTNLLALNAAIEAARAGEHGRGFAVVADEVRKLAERTTNSTQQIVESINAIRQETGRAVQEISTGASKVKAGVERAGQAGTNIRQIMACSHEVGDLVATIAAAAAEQGLAAGDASRGIDAVRSAANEVSAAAAQSSTASGELSRKSEELAAVVRRFKLEGRKSEAGSRPDGHEPHADIKSRKSRPSKHAINTH